MEMVIINTQRYTPTIFSVLSFVLWHVIQITSYIASLKGMVGTTSFSQLRNQMHLRPQKE